MKVKHECSSCGFRHCCCFDRDECNENNNNKYWCLGNCYLCVHRHAPDDEWFQRGCEVWCMGGCEKFKRDWKATFRWLFKKEVDLD